VHYRLGDALYQLERAQEALAPLERAARLAGNVAAHHYKLGNALKDLERLDDALACYRRALEREPRHAQSLTNTGVILEMQGRTDEALDYYRRAIEANGALRPARIDLATLLHRTERFAEAVEAYQGLLELDPGSAPDWGNLGNAYQGLERYHDSARCYERALAIDPASPGVHYRLGIALLGLGKHAESEAAARRAVEITPGHPEGWVNLGDVLQAQRRFDEALAAYQRGLELNPGIPELLNNMGAAYRNKHSLEAAYRFFERAVEASPGFASARVNLSSARLSLGLDAEAIAGFREVLEREPQNEPAARHLLMALLYGRGNADELFEEHLSFARRFAAADAAAPVWNSAAAPGRKLRIGYVSSDLRMHPVGYNLASVIQNHNRDAFEVHVYSNVKRPDHMTRWFQDQVDVWHSIVPLSDRAAAELIRQDQVDILVLVAGRFDDNRPLLATHRAAPIQVSMHDPATSGLAEMDYLIADRALVPRHTTEKFTERVVCLPTFFLNPPLDDAPQIPAHPAARNGRVTFGSFNNLAKINEGVVEVWARVLRGVPGSRLLLKYRGVFAIPSVRSRIVDRFREHGIEEERLLLPGHGGEDRARHLERYGEIDIALDPFPFTGSTTTFEALWMGVPVVTLEGSRMVARWSAAMLRKVGLPHLIARNEAEYVEIARQLASNPGELARLRAELRDRVARSPLCAEQARTRQLERLYRRMWAIHVNEQKTS